MQKRPYYISTAISYTSRVPHIGNTYEAVLADAIARFKRLEGYDVFFLTGTDEHGEKIQIQAQSEGITPQQHVDKIAAEIKRIWDFMNVSYDKFIRTTDDYHVDAVSAIFEKLYEQGDIYKGSYEGYYCTPCESFFTETQVEDGKCPDCGREVHKASEEAYFFKLSKYARQLEEYIENHPDFIQPESRKNEMLNNFIKPGLQDLCVSRSTFNWGVPVKFDKAHVVYVWIDALSNYITALGYRPDEKNAQLFDKYWPADVHLIGKDILRFHTIYWPCMLMALGLPMPKKIFGHPWLLMGDDKMSKSKGNVVYAEQLVKLFGVDATRYYLLHEMPFASDGNFTYELLISKTNSDLANVLGNLVNRTISMVEKYFDGIIPPPNTENAFDVDLKACAAQALAGAVKNMNALRVADAMDCIWSLLRRCNKYIDETMPWALAKTGDFTRLATVLYNLCEGIRIAAVLIKPFLPDTAEKMLSQIGTDLSDFDSISSFGALKPETHTGKAEPLFARIDEKEKQREIEAMLSENTTEKKKNDGLAIIGIDDFAKVELVTAKILSCEEIKKSNKLYKLQVSIGDEQRQVCSGIKNYYAPDELVGKTVVLVKNLKPVKLCGEESCGMILAADDNGKVKVLFIDGISPGSTIR